MSSEILRCADLHNNIVRFGWHVTSAPFVSFWEKHSHHQPRIEELASEDVIAFYKKALVPAGTISAEDPYQNLFYYIQGLSRPWDNLPGDSPDRLKYRGNGRRYILFYMATSVLGGHQGGIILDQQTGLASVQPDFLSVEPCIMAWQPLSAILATYLGLITLGKISPANYKPASEPPRPGRIGPPYPWKYHSYSSEILVRTLNAYHGLISAIEAALDVPTRERDHELTVYLSTHSNLDAAGFPKAAFARSFLTRARRPRGPKRIQFIAPGIELPSTTSIRNQPFKAVAKRHRFASVVPGLPSINDEDESNPLYPPFLLFPGLGVRAKKDSGDDTVFAAPFNQLEDCPVGLWVDKAEPWSGRGGEDEAVVVLPLEPPRRGHATFEAGTKLPLFAVLEEWTGLVESGQWKVDDRGVVGDIDLLQDEKSETRGRTRTRDV